jgi:hypothetical protein
MTSVYLIGVRNEGGGGVPEHSKAIVPAHTQKKGEFEKVLAAEKGY